MSSVMPSDSSTTSNANHHPAFTFYSSPKNRSLRENANVIIDRSFVDRIKEGGENIGFAKTIIMLANDLGMEVIAEGIERKEQINELIKVGCQFGQGYYFSKPVESISIEKLIQDMK